jgi:hypothetical protein
VAPTYVPPLAATEYVGDKGGDNSLTLVIDSVSGYVQLMQYDGMNWDIKFKRDITYPSSQLTADLYSNIVVIGIPHFNAAERGKVEIWTFDSELSGFSNAYQERGWTQVSNQPTWLKGQDGDSFGLSVSFADGLIYAMSVSSDYAKSYVYANNVPSVLGRNTASKRDNIIELNDSKCYLLAESDLNAMSYDTQTGVFLHPIYDADSFIVESLQSRDSTTTTRAPNAALNQVIQTDKTSICFIDETSHNIQIYDTNVGNYVDLPTHITIYQHMVSYDFSEFQSLSSPQLYLSGMNYSHVVELPLDDQNTDYDGAIIYGDSFYLQNHFDQKYDLDIEYTPGYEQVNVHHTRDYKRIGATEQDVWLSFTPSKEYVQNGDVYITSGLLDDPLASYRTTGITYDSSVTDKAYGYEYIERLYGVNKRTGLNNHKSNIFSIEIRDSNLNESITDEQTRAMLHRVVERAIREFVKKTAPAHCQFWKVIWRGK